MHQTLTTLSIGTAMSVAPLTAKKVTIYNANVDPIAIIANSAYLIINAPNFVSLFAFNDEAETETLTNCQFNDTSNVEVSSKMNEQLSASKDNDDLQFDFDFDALEDDNISNNSDSNDTQTRPYQWGNNIQFVNMDTNKLPLRQRASNSLTIGYTQKHLDRLSNNNLSLNPSQFPKLLAASNIFYELEKNIMFDEEKRIRFSDDEDNDMKPIQTRQISTFKPAMYDICTLMSFPLSIEGIDNDKIPLSSLEYIRSYLPDFTEFNDYLHEDILLSSAYNLRFAHFVGNIENFSAIKSDGGCKILQFVAYVWNPTKHKEHPLRYTFPQNEKYYDCDTDYILIQTAHSSGQWIKVDDLKEIIGFHSNLNDIVIVISPQYEQLSKIFCSVLGFRYVIGVECVSNNFSSFSSCETAVFLKYFYSSLLNQECVDRAFDLAETAAIIQRTGSVAILFPF